MPADAISAGRRLQERAEQRYNWDAVTTQYEALATRLVTGASQARRFSGRRAPQK